MVVKSSALKVKATKEPASKPSSKANIITDLPNAIKENIDTYVRAADEIKHLEADKKIARVEVVRLAKEIFTNNVISQGVTENFKMAGNESAVNLLFRIGVRV